MSDLTDVDSLSVSSIQSQKGALDEGKLREQASRNVARQTFSKQIRTAEAPPAPAPAPKKQPAADNAKEKAKLAAENQENMDKVHDFLTHPLFRERLSSIPRPQRGTPEEYKSCLASIRKKLNSGGGDIAMKALYLRVVSFIDPLAATMPPDHLKIPPGSSNYCAMQMQRLDAEFAQLSIEYGQWFTSGPLGRIVMKTADMMMEYRKLVEAGSMPLLIPQQGEVTKKDAIEENQQLPPMPEPTRMYPDPTPSDRVYASIITHEEAPTSGPPIPSSSGENLWSGQTFNSLEAGLVEDDFPVVDTPPPVPKSAPKKKRGGGRRI